MRVDFDTRDVPRENRGEIAAVLQGIAVGPSAGQWAERPDGITIVGRLAGGRSGTEVLEAVVRWGNRESRKVIKLGALHEVRNEFHAFRAHLRHASRFFVPIEAVTPALLKDDPEPQLGREAAVYDDAGRFVGGSPRTFEQVAREAVATGGPQFDAAVNALRVLFPGIRNNLYDDHEFDTRETALRDSWNRRLGDDAKLAVAAAGCGQRRLGVDPPGANLLYPYDLARASVRLEADHLGRAVALDDARLTWWGERLMAEVDDYSLRVEVIPEPGLDLREVVGDLEDGASRSVVGRLVELRALKHRDRLLHGLPDLALDSGILAGPGAAVADPFAFLARLLESPRAGRVTSLVHGDLNPRNLLLVGSEPCLIDYALTAKGEPIFLDFTRLEGCLARDTLPAHLTWGQHLRLQRLLTWAMRLGDEAAREFAARLAADRPELGRAFQLFWAIRQAARAVYPATDPDVWLQDYLEQLFLFAHLTLKWENSSPAALTATAAMAGVAAEALAPETSFRLWGEDRLRDDGLSVLDMMRRSRHFLLPALASFARRTYPLVRRPDDPLQAAFDAARADLVRHRFHDQANELLRQLQKDHDVYISLRAFIDLKGQLSAGRAARRGPLAMEALLNDDQFLADRERLRQGGQHGDALDFVATHPALVLLGDAGAGKTTVAREWEYRLARAIVGADDTAPVRLPLVVRASEVEAALGKWDPRSPETIAKVLDRTPYDLAVGALHVVVDALNELTDAPRRKVADWVMALREAFPHTPVLVCHRQYNYVPGLLGPSFPVLLLEKVELDQAREYIHSYLREKHTPDHEARAEALIRPLFDNPDLEQVRDLAQTPLFLWMIVERYRLTESLPTSRGALFEDFSRWYLEGRYREEHGEPISITTTTYEEKAAFLGCLGYALVRAGRTVLPEAEVKRSLTRKLRTRSQELLHDTLAAEMLLPDPGGVRFMHQSFQEYFAARHFLEHEAGNPETVRARVREHGWHDTFALLLGFGGDKPEVIREVIAEALRCHPALTARCLRMAETPDSQLLDQFVAAQQETLRDSQSGEYPQQRAAEALAEYGRGPARAALRKVATDPAAPEFSRRNCLQRLTAMVGQARFDAITGKIRGELAQVLISLFDEPAPLGLCEAALAAITNTKLRDLDAYLAGLVQAEEWPLTRAAWKACQELGLVLPPKARAAFTAASFARLPALEEEQAKEAVMHRYEALNEERLELLRHLAAPEYLSLLVARRFAFGIQEEVGKLIAHLATQPGGPPAEAEIAWAALRDSPDASPEAIARWISLLSDPEELTALAAAHRLCAVAKQVPSEALSQLLGTDLPVRRLAAVAWVVAASGRKDLAEPLAARVRDLTETVSGPEEMEAFSSLVAALQALEPSQGRRAIAVAMHVFRDRRFAEAAPGVSAWRHLASQVYLTPEDYSVLLQSSEDESRVALHWLTASAGAVTMECYRSYQIELTESAMKRFLEIPRLATEPERQMRVAVAAVEVKATTLLPWMLDLAESPEMDGTFQGWHGVYGRILDPYLSYVLRAIGCLSRMLLDKKRAEAARPAVEYLQRRYDALGPEEDRPVVVALTTALGYLGDWEPILTHLGPGEPWMHEAAGNVFTYWIPGPLAAEPEKENERAVRWINRRLRDNPGLPPQVRSTLTKLKDDLERKLGRYLPEEAP